MRVNTSDYMIITFSETTRALYMERICKEDGVHGRIIPLPKSVDAGCGLVWASEKRDRVFWITYMENRGIEYEEIMEVSV